MHSFTAITLVVLVSLIPGRIYAEQASAKKTKSSPMAEPTKEQRAKMADVHAQLAECLRSDKPFQECHKQMMENCPMMGKDGSCSMMGMHHHGMMKSDEKSKDGK